VLETEKKFAGIHIVDELTPQNIQDLKDNLSKLKDFNFTLVKSRIKLT